MPTTLCIPSSFAGLDDEGLDEEEQVVFKGLPARSLSSEAAPMQDNEALDSVQQSELDFFKSKPADLLLIDDTEVVITIMNSWVHFQLCRELDLKSVSCKLRNAEYNPRNGAQRMILRLLQPAAQATIWSKGSVRCCVKGNGDGRIAARRITRLVQMLGPVAIGMFWLTNRKVQQSARESLQNSSRLLLEKGHPLRWLLVPWVLLLLPLIVGSAMGPMALLGGAALTLASIACLSFLIAIVIVIVQRRCLHCTRRWRRLYRLRSLQRRPYLISAAFGDSGPCCICLGDSDSRDALIALLPCRHALHATCYASWVSADAYPSSSLICPVCRCRADSIGKLSPIETA
eukprot:g32825.t1